MCGLGVLKIWTVSENVFPLHMGSKATFIEKVLHVRRILEKYNTGSTISTLLHDKINTKDCQVLSVGDSGFLLFSRVVSSDYGKPRNTLR